MNRSPLIENLRTSLAPGAKARFLAYGSSNTERFLAGMHWSDVLELALRDSYGRFHRVINTGQCGDTSRGLLERFPEEAALYRPHLAIITIGGNDSNPGRGISPAEFTANLRELQRRFGELGSQVVFQTYYAPDLANPDDLANFGAYMQLVRETAQATQSLLVDHLVRWEAFRRAHYEQYRELLHDAFHVNARGNAVLGLDLARQLGAQPADKPAGFWQEALAIQREMDALCPPPPAD